MWITAGLSIHVIVRLGELSDTLSAGRKCMSMLKSNAACTACRRRAVQIPMHWVVKHFGLLNACRSGRLAEKDLVLESR